MMVTSSTKSFFLSVVRIKERNSWRIDKNKLRHLQTPDVASCNHAKWRSPYLQKASRRVGRGEGWGDWLRGAGGETGTLWSGDFMVSFRGLSYVDQSPWDRAVWSDEAPPPSRPSENGREAACAAVWLECGGETSLKVTGTSLATCSSCLTPLGTHLYCVRRRFKWTSRQIPGSSSGVAKCCVFVFLPHGGNMMGCGLGCGLQRHLELVTNVHCDKCYSCYVIRNERLKLWWIAQCKDSIV